MQKFRLPEQDSVAERSPEQKIVGIRTDFRRAGESKGAVVNAMIEGACDQIVRSREEVLEAVEVFLIRVNF